MKTMVLREEEAKINKTMDEFIAQSVYGVFALMAILHKFEFYFLYASKFDGYLKSQLENNVSGVG